MKFRKKLSLRQNEKEGEGIAADGGDEGGELSEDVVIFDESKDPREKVTFFNLPICQPKMAKMDDLIIEPEEMKECNQIIQSKGYDIVNLTDYRYSIEAFL